MDYIEIIATVPAAGADSAAALLREVAESGAWIEAPFTQADLESDAIVDIAAATRIHVYAPASPGADAIAGTASEALSTAGIEASVSVRRVAEEDWAESWKEYFHVERFGARIVVVPSWREYRVHADDVVLNLDPGMAFGTGQHETTRMCLEALERHVRPGLRVLDVGCGSGILSIAAARLGATSVYAVDVDPNCVNITRQNAELNAVASVVCAEHVNSIDGPLGNHVGGADIVVVNIIARVIVELAAALVDAAAPGGRIIASGIIGEREDDAVRALSDAGAHVVSTRWLGDWRCVEAVLSTAAPV